MTILMTFMTERLELIPLTLSQLKMMYESVPLLEKELAITYRGEPMEGFMHDYLGDQIHIIEEHPQSVMYNAFWLIVRKSDRIAVGSAAFKGMPGSDGRIEIGYGLGDGFEHMGYMTEAVKGMCEWALSQDIVSGVTAETDPEPDGLPSQRVLSRCGFKRINVNPPLFVLERI